MKRLVSIILVIMLVVTTTGVDVQAKTKLKNGTYLTAVYGKKTVYTVDDIDEVIAPSKKAYIKNDTLYIEGYIERINSKTRRTIKPYPYKKYSIKLAKKCKITGWSRADGVYKLTKKDVNDIIQDGISRGYGSVIEFVIKNNKIVSIRTDG